MEDHISLVIGNSEASSDTKYLFSACYFNMPVDGSQMLTEKNSYRFYVKRPGFYNIKALVKNRDSAYEIISPHKYIEPDTIFDLNKGDERIALERSFCRIHACKRPEAYKASVNGQKFDFLCFPHQQENLFVLCPSAIIRKTYPVPYFYRWQWAVQNKFPGNVIVVSDPTFDLHPEMEKGWFVGSRDNDATLNFCEIIKLFCKNLKIQYKNIVFWGSSAGGFIAMQMCKYFPGSSAVAVNAQTDIYKYNGYQLLYQIGFPGLTDNEINRQYKDRLSTIENIQKFKKNKIFMVQNILDSSHYEDHFMPFASKIMDINSLKKGIFHIECTPFTFWLYSHPDGHIPETPKMADIIIKRLGFFKKIYSNDSQNKKE